MNKSKEMGRIITVGGLVKCGDNVLENLKEAKKETKHFFISWLLFN